MLQSRKYSNNATFIEQYRKIVTFLSVLKVTDEVSPLLIIGEKNINKIYLYFFQEDLIAVSFPFSRETIKLMKLINGNRFHNEEKKFWSVPKTDQSLKVLFRIFANYRITVDPSLDNYLRKVFGNDSDKINRQIIQRMSDELVLRGYSRKSRKAYLGHIQRFAQRCRKDLQNVEGNEIRSYILYLLEELNSSHSYTNQCISALRFLYSHLLHDGDKIRELPRPKKEKDTSNCLKPG